MKLYRSSIVARHFALSWGYEIMHDAQYSLTLHWGATGLAGPGRPRYARRLIIWWDRPQLVYGEAGWKEQRGFGMPVPQEAKRTWYGKTRTRWIERLIWRRGVELTRVHP